MYMKNGFNETLTFHTDSQGNLVALSYEVIDYNYLASLEKNPKRKRLLTTKQFDMFDTKAQIAPLFEGTRPIFTKVKYDALGRELKEKAAGAEGVPEEEPGFFRKYWLYILLAFLILPNLLSVDPGAAEGAAGGGQGGAPAAGAGAGRK